MIYVAYVASLTRAVRAAWPDIAPTLGDGAACLVNGALGFVHGCNVDLEIRDAIHSSLAQLDLVICDEFPSEVTFDVRADD